MIKMEAEILLEQKRDHVEKSTPASELGTFQLKGMFQHRRVELPVAHPQEESPWQALLDTQLSWARSSPEVPALSPQPPESSSHVTVKETMAHSRE